jgi:hypothetical protein
VRSPWLVLLACGLLGGCAVGLLGGCAFGGGSPAPERSTSTATESKLAQAQATHEYPSPSPRQRVRAAAPSAIEAVAIFATAYINWDASTVSADMRGLAARSIGQARSAMQLAAANTAQDYELRRGGIANSGQVKAIAPLAGSPNHFVVVTLERTTATATSAYAGLRPAWHLAIATVARVAGARWVVSGWQPEN